ncbi:Caveolae-associated protein 2 [Merluccius polli]|uniref:Caveolae-associated protein 2 n=1 Tax=Merluccius polli TaxID=89951 RepID=A0AA47MGW2_MERPO|nr:Caveolae-associated protein 2 [Merluccius polli]
MQRVWHQSLRIGAQEECEAPDWPRPRAEAQLELIDVGCQGKVGRAGHYGNARTIRVCLVVGVYLCVGMCEEPLRLQQQQQHNINNIMVTTEEPQSQELRVPGPSARPASPNRELPALGMGAGGTGLDPQGPVNAITVLTLLDKLVNMLDTVQENQHKMEVQQVDMETVVMGIQADVTKLSKNHSHTANTVSKLLDKSRKLSVTMKEVRERMERQGVQVKKLEANHAHLIQRNNFKVLIFQEEKEIPSSVFVKQPVPFPRDGVDEEEEGGEGEPSPPQDNPAHEEGLHTIDLSSDEDVGLEAELEEEGEKLYDLDFMEKTRAEKIKRSSLKKVDSLKRAFSKQNIEKKMTKIGTKIVSQEQRDKIKKSLSSNQQRATFKVPPLSFSLRKARGSSESQPAEPQAPAQTGDFPTTEAHIELSPLAIADEELSFTEVHSQLAPGGAEEREEEKEEEEEEISGCVEGEASMVSEGVSVEYSLSATLPQEAHSPPSAWGGEEEEEEEEEKKKEKEEEENEKGE